MRTAWTARILIGVIATLSLAVAAAGWLRHRADNRQVEHFTKIGRDAYVLAAPEPIAPFRLVRHDGAPFEPAALAGAWTFLFFGFTHCPDACPATLGVLREIHQRLASGADAAHKVRFVLVTVDPQRDTPPVLERYLAQFDPSFVGVTGEAEPLGRFTAPFGVAYEKAASATGRGYHMDHSSSVLLIDPQGRLHGILAAPHTAEAMLRAFAVIRERAPDGKGPA
jgi:protein SCO1